MPEKKLKRVRQPDKWAQYQFDDVIGDTEYSFEVREALRSVMVLGKSQTEAALSMNLTRQRINQLVKGLRKRHTPNGWVTASVTAPPEVMERILHLERDAREKFGRTKSRV